ncbi:multiple stress resistance protein BhsA [Pectobacterium sp. B1J-3]|uniref:multiple stress resistance protein BhsA n=1 Tax=Pectobacterium sp. B1J-3 TaxID=3385371 RepID=UPI0039058864
MKNVKTIAAAIVLATVSFGTFAAEHIDAQQAKQHQKLGVVSVTGAKDLSSLQAQLAEKAEKAGAQTYTITSATGNNLLRGTAVIYN